MKKYIKRLLEVLVVMLLFYGNIFMGYFTKSHLAGKSMAIMGILNDMMTPQMFVIAFVSGIISTIILNYIENN